jgi:23S rRNA pseudouridine2605 synthase
VGRGRWELTITLSEGRNREVRRLCEALGLQVDRLIRVKFGPVALGELPVGQVRSLTKAERTALEKL